MIQQLKYKCWEIWHNLKCWTWYRYGTIRCRNLPHTWSDRRTILLCISFQILCDFIDKECSPGYAVWYGSGCPKVMVNGVNENVMDEMKELKWWWEEIHEKEYPAKCEKIWSKVLECDFSPLKGDLKMGQKNKALFRELNSLTHYMDEKAEEMLKRLAAVRLWMWT